MNTASKHGEHLLGRREFLTHASSCAAHLALAAAVMPASFRALWARAPLGPVVAREPFGALERVAEGVWALISTPLNGDRTTVSNGGIIAGKTGVLAIEGFMQPAGAQWLAKQARELTGRQPTHVVVTHYHADHANGIAGYRMEASAPVLRATPATRDLVVEKNRPADSAREAAFRDTVVIGEQAATIDLGGRVVRVVPRRGHTASDVTLELDDPSVVFCGDLVWNAMFPNFVDAVPTQLAAAVRALRRDRNTIYVPGHGALSREPELARYVAMLEEVERAARRAHAAGTSAADAASGFTLPASLGEWRLFGPTFFERAFTAWYRELAPDASSGQG